MASGGDGSGGNGVAAAMRAAHRRRGSTLQCMGPSQGAAVPSSGGERAACSLSALPRPRAGGMQALVLYGASKHNGARCSAGPTSAIEWWLEPRGGTVERPWTLPQAVGRGDGAPSWPPGAVHEECMPSRAGPQQPPAPASISSNSKSAIGAAAGPIASSNERGRALWASCGRRQRLQ